MNNEHGMNDGDEHENDTRDDHEHEADQGEEANDGTDDTLAPFLGQKKGKRWAEDGDEIEHVTDPCVVLLLVHEVLSAPNTGAVGSILGVRPKRRQAVSVIICVPPIGGQPVDTPAQPKAPCPGIRHCRCSARGGAHPATTGDQTQAVELLCVEDRSRRAARGRA
jgi:hypothetical protein